MMKNTPEMKNQHNNDDADTMFLTKNSIRKLYEKSSTRKPYDNPFFEGSKEIFEI